MAKGKTASNSKARVKAPRKKVALLKKAPVPQHKSTNKGSRKQVADDIDDESSGESSEEPDPRPQKKHCGKKKEISNREEEVDNEEPDEVIQVDDESDSEV